MFSSKSFIVLALIFKSLIHFELIFIYDVVLGSNVILLHVDIQFSQDHLLKRGIPFEAKNLLFLSAYNKL